MWCVVFLLHYEDFFRTERGFFTEAEARAWAAAENLQERCDEFYIEPDE